MPTINCIEYVNVGYPSCFCEDVKLKAGSVQTKNGVLGGHVYVLADNGIGKSSLIALALYVIRPYMTDFLKGEEGSFRHISQYITNEGTNLILIEWILDNRSQEKAQSFLLTGYAASSENTTKLDGVKKDIKELFFSCRYTTNPGNEDVTLENLPFKKENNDATLSEIRNFFNKKKKEQPLQEIFCDDVKEDWINNLAQYNIESELFLIQSKINQKEGAQQTILNFSNPKDFLNKIIYYSVPFDDVEEQKQLMRGLEENFDKLKRGAFYSTQIEYYTILLSKLAAYQPLTTSFSNNLQEINQTVKQAAQYRMQCQILLQFLSQQKAIVQQNIRNIEDLCNQEKSKKFSHEKKLLQTELLETMKNIDEKNKEIEKNKETLKKVSREIALYSLFPDYSKSLQLEMEITTLTNLISDKNKPLQQDYEEKAVAFAIKLEYNLQLLVEKIKRTRTELTTIDKKNEEKSQQIGEAKEKIKGKQIEINILKSKIDKIETMQADLEKKNILKPNIIPRKVLKTLESQIKKSDEEIELLSGQISCVNETISELKSKLYANQYKKSTYEKTVQDTNQEIANVMKEWKFITQLPFFKEKIDSSIQIAEDVHYLLIEDSEIKIWTDEKEAFNNKIKETHYDIENINKIVCFYNENGYFPPNTEVSQLYNWIKENKFAVHYGWDYVKNNYADHPDIIKKLYQKFPHYLEGLIIGEDLSKLDVILKEYESKNQVSSPIFIVNTALLEQIIKTPEAQIETNFYRIISEGLERKIIEEKMQGYAEKLNLKIQELTKISKDLQNKSSKYETFLEKTKTFKIKYPTQFLQQKRELVFQSSNMITELTKIIEKLSEELTVNQDLVSSYIQNQNQLKVQKQTDQSNYNLLNQSISELESLSQINQEIKEKETEIDQLTLDLEKHNIEKKQYAREKEQIMNQYIDLTHNQQELNNLDSKIETKLKEKAKLIHESKKSDILSSNFENLKLQFLEALARFKENPEIKSLQEKKERNMNELKELNSKIKTDKPDLEKMQKECANYNSSDFIRIIAVKNEEKDSINNTNGGLEYELKGLDKTKRDQRKQWREKYTENFDEKQIKLDMLELDKLYIQILSLRESIQKNIEIENQCEKEIVENRKNLDQILSGEENGVKLIRVAETISQELLPKCENPQEILTHISVPNLELNIDTWNGFITEICGKIQTLENKKRQILYENAQIQNKINDFCNDIINFTANNKYSQIRIETHVESFISFGFKNFLNIPTITTEITRRKEQLIQLVKEIEDDFKSIKTAINSRILSLYTALQHIQNTSLPVPATSNLKGSKVFEIKWIKPIDQAILVDYVRDRIEEYIAVLLHEEKFPSRLLGYIDFIRDVFENCFSQNIKDVMFLIPRPNNSAPILKPFLEMQNSSGGEKTNLAILIFCLIASYRLNQIINKKRNLFRGNTLSITLFMDNPIGKASRDDFIELQTKLAEDLQIQLIIFSAIRNPEILVHFNTVIPLFSYSEGDQGERIRRDILKEDSTDQMYKLASSAISRTRTITLESVFDSKKGERNGS